MRILFVAVLCLVGWCATALACTPPPQEIFHDGPITMGPEQPLVLEFVLINGAPRDIQVVDSAGTLMDGEVRYYELGTVEQIDNYQESVLFVWTPEGPVSESDELFVEWGRTLDSRETAPIVIAASSVPAMGPVDPERIDVQIVARTEIRCEPVPEDTPGVCPVCSYVDTEGREVVADFGLTDSRFIVRRLQAADIDGTTQGENSFLWDAGTETQSFKDFLRVDSCFVAELIDVRDPMVVSGELRCFDASGEEIDPSEVADPSPDPDEPDPDVNNPDVPDEPNDTGDAGSKGEADGCSTTGGVASPWWLLVGLGLIWRRR